MQCSAEQIAAKRRLAMQKLAEKKNKPAQTNLSGGSSLNNSPAKKFASFPNYNNSTATLKSGRPNLNSINISSAKSIAHPNAFMSNTISSPVKQFNTNYSNAGAMKFNNQPSTNTFQSNHFTMKTDNSNANSYKQTGGNDAPVCNFNGLANKTVKCKVSLISLEKFAVDMLGFSTVAVDTMKTIPSRFYEPKSKIWSFHIKDYDLFQSKMSQLKPDVSVDKLPQFVINCCRSKPTYNAYDLSRIDSELLSALMPFQEEGVCFGIEKNGRCFIADDMGLGKTFQALAIANYYKDDWPLLIVTTASMKNVWEGTIHKYMPTVPIMSVQYMVSGRDFIDSSKILILSHDLMSRCIDKLMDRGFGAIIIDESHVLKNFKTKCTKSAQSLAKRAKRVILLSGTPALSRPSELFTQLSLIDERFFGTFFDYSKRYCDGKTTSFGWDATGQSNLQELEIVLAKKFMIRRTKEDVLKTLPNKIQEVVSLDVDLNQFSEEDRECLLALAVKYNTVKKDKHAALLTFFAETAKIKIPSVCSYILQVLEGNQKFLVFAHHQIMLNSIEKVLQKKKKKFIRIDGNTTSDQRKYLVDKFQLDDSYVCAVLSITAANAGITLTAAQLVLFAELHWNPSILSQAESRAHRIGQEGQVTIQYLLAPGTADDSIWPLLQNKQKILKEIGLMHDSFSQVSVKPQNKRTYSDISNDLNTSITSANTLNITSYFTASPKKGKLNENASGSNLENEFLNDNFDDIFDNVDF